MTEAAFTWSHGEAVVSTTAGMLLGCVFQLDGRAFDPFASAPWTADAFPGLPGHLRVLGAEFVCLPFGEGGPLPEAVPEWAPLLGGPPNVPGHGAAADEEWRIEDRRAGGVTLILDRPDHDPIQRLERRIDGVPGEPELQFSLTITARRATATSLGLHPILRLPQTPRSLRVEADFEAGFTYPAPTAPGHSRVHPGERFTRLDAVPASDGEADFSRLPFEQPTEDVVQLAGVRAPVSVVFVQEGAGVEIEWDRTLLPSVQLWLSDRVLEGDPWKGRYRGLGVEPIASAFDLSSDVSTHPNPISRAGFGTAVELAGGETLETTYSLRAFSQK